MYLFFIRHGATTGNILKKYIGATDEPLCPEGIAALLQRRNAGVYEAAQAAAAGGCAIWISPMRRCLETAELIFTGRKFLTSDGLRECDFGSFEGKSWQELQGDDDYQAWIDSGGSMKFPGGEGPDAFRGRCRRAFCEIISDARKGSSQGAGETDMIFVVHGGTIMSLMSAFAVPHRDYFDWHVGNGGGFECSLNGSIMVMKSSF